jgi:uncharacterized membrane protein
VTTSLSHLHLILNHVPTVGMAVAVGLLFLAFARKHEPLKHAGLEVLFIIAIVTMPAYMTGLAARLELLDRSGVSDTAMRRHHDAALAGFTVTELAGFGAWIALWQSRRRGRASPAMMAAVLVLSVAALALMGRAANIGGEIRHPEILGAGPAAQSPAFVDRDAAAVAGQAGAADVDSSQFVTAAISTYMVDSSWAWPAAEAVHFLGLSLTFGVLLAVNLRILGAMKQVAFTDVHRLLPWGMLGFGANFITGMLFVIGQPRQYMDSAPFYWKVALMMIAAANFLYLTVFKRAWAAGHFQASLADRVMAFSSIAVWLGVLYAGRMLPFLGRAF